MQEGQASWQVGADEATATAIARQHRHALAAPHTKQAAARGELLTLADHAGQPVAFADFHRRADGQITIYAIAVAADQQAQGAGRYLLALLADLPGATCLLARCPVDLASNGWYQRLGFTLADVEQPTGKRALNVWRLDLPAPALVTSGKYVTEVALALAEHNGG